MTVVKKQEKSNNNNIESIYPLSPMQQGMLFHSLYAPESGVYFEQLSFTIHSQLNVNAFERAWQRVIERHPVLRTLFVWDNPKRPLQVVLRSVTSPWNNYDWRSLSVPEQQKQLENFLEQDRQLGFEFNKAPLMRCTLIKLADDNYKFIWSHHHILIDGWCLPIILKEVLDFYDAFIQGQDLSLSIPRPYRDYISWLQKQDSSKAEVFWKQQLKNFTAPTPLVVDVDKSKEKNIHQKWGELSFKLSTELTKAIESLAKEHRLTLNTILQGVWAILLHRYSGESDIIFGSTVSGRSPTLQGVESMIGLFINTLPLRIQVSEETDVLSWLKQLQVQQVEQQQYSYTPLVEIQRWSDISRGHPLFNSILVFENYPIDKSLYQQQVNLDIREIEYFDRTNYPLTIVTIPGENLTIRITHDLNSFESDTIERIFGHLETLLQAIVTSPEQSVGRLPLLTQAEEQQILIEWNQTATEYPQDKCIHQLFEEQVAKTPDAVAVVFEEEQLTYGELNSRANQLAHYLQSLGVKPEVLVGICVERSLEMIVGLLGILKAGGAYVPLDPAYPQERLAYMLEDSRVPVLLTQKKLLEQLPQHSAYEICLDRDWEIIAKKSKDNSWTEVTNENLAYVIYTSGSTGKPKGVAMKHHPLYNLILWQIQDSKVVEEAKTLQFAPISFDVSFQEIFSTWCSGGKLVLVREELRKDALALLSFLAKESIERLFLPFVALQQLAEVAKTYQIFPDNLQEVITAGEQLQITPAISQFFSRLTDCTLHNHYGPSESHVVTAFTLPNSVQDWSSLPPIGRPITNAKIYILDQQLKPVPIGIPGELCIGDFCLAQGYLNRQELTNKKFITSPFSNEPDHRLYKTGDLARYLPDGNIEFLGRIDNQVKIRGFRIELGEIESILTQHPEIREAIVIAREDQPGNKRLVAYFVPKEQHPTISALRDFLKTRLPDYMVPSAFVNLETMPLTPNGKVDRRNLPVPDSNSLSTGTIFVAPRTPTEELLSVIWNEVLGLEKVGINDNFFDLGGHSLLATQVISRIREAFSIELPLRSLFESSTIAQLSQEIETIRRAATGLDIPIIKPISRDKDLTLSWAQERLWFLAQLEGESATYNMPGAIQLEGSLQMNALEQAIQEIVRRHEILRTTFQTRNGLAVQVISEDAHICLTVRDLQALPTKEQSVTVQQLAKEEAQKTFHLSEYPLLHLTLLQLSSQSQVLLVNMHHIISDGWSMGIFIQELSRLYQAYYQGEDSPLAELAIQYADFAHWQREYLSGKVLEQQLNYWQKQLEGIPPLLELPTDRPRPSVQTNRGGREKFELGLELTQQLKSLSHASGTTLFMTLLAAFSTLLYRLSGQTDIVVGSPIANRNRSEIEPLIGFFVNTLVLRSQLTDNPTFAELLSQVRQISLDAYVHQDVPFEQLVEALQPERNLSHSPLFQVMFVLQNEPREKLELPGLSLTLMEIESEIAKFDLTLSMEETERGLIGYWEYNSDLFEAKTICRWVGHFQVLLESLVANPEQRVSQLPMLTEAERQQLLVEWNDTRVDYPQDKCIHQLFEKQVAKTPEAVAVVFEEEQLTYGELNSRANQLAHYLKSLGVKPEVLVGICVERSLEMIVGLLGILKAGGAYVPLDPAYPPERLAYMLEDSAVPVLLTQERLVSNLPVHQAQVVCLDSHWQVISQQSRHNLISSINPENLAYTIYTSGSTGKPKGVLITHKALLNLVNWHQSAFEVTSLDRATQLAGTAFDASVWELWPYLAIGASIHLVKPTLINAPENLRDWLVSQRISISFLPTPLAENLLTLEWPKNTALRFMLTGGDKLHNYPSTLIPFKLVNNYGPTENTVVATSAVVNHTEKNSLPSIGSPIANTKIYILDAYLQPVPIGVTGELYINGVGLARGYLNLPKLTAEKFISNPFSQENRSRLYKTGDLVRYLPDGNIEYLGRVDHQVKIRGFRIELGEIESVLAQNYQVREVVAIAREHPSGNKHLVAYIVSNLDSLIASELRNYLKTKLPEYMIPYAFVQLESLPLTPNGKVDLRGLPQPNMFERTLEDSLIAPRDPLEMKLVQIWETVMGIHPIGVKDNFFDLGGYSLSAVKLIAEIEQQFNKDIPLAALFQNPTIEQLASLLRQKSNSLFPSPLVAMKPGGSRPPLFLVHSLNGNAASYSELVRHFAPEQPIYGLQAVGLDGKEKPLVRVEDMAELYVKTIQTFRPQGPYYLAGWSFGGLIAFEIAQQFQALGQKVAFLGLLDTYHPSMLEEELNDEKIYTVFLTDRCGHDSVRALENLKKLQPDKQLLYVMEQSKQARVIPPDLRLEEMNFIVQVHKSNIQAARHYVPKPYPDKITFFRVKKEAESDPQDATLGWKEVADQRVDVHRVPGSHADMVHEPHAQILAEQLCMCIKQIHTT